MLPRLASLSLSLSLACSLNTHQRSLRCFTKLDDDGGGSLSRKELVLGLTPLHTCIHTCTQYIHHSISRKKLVCPHAPPIACMHEHIHMHSCLHHTHARARTHTHTHTNTQNTSGLFKLGVWLHPLESQALMDALDEDGGGEIEEDELVSFWTNYLFDGFDQDA